MIGQNSHGNWVGQDQEGICGGLFIDREAALRFAREENGYRPHTLIVASSNLEIDISGKHRQPLTTPIGAGEPDFHVCYWLYRGGWPMAKHVLGVEAGAVGSCPTVGGSDCAADRYPFRETNPVPVKYALALLGIISPKVRLPLVGLGEPILCGIATATPPNMRRVFRIRDWPYCDQLCSSRPICHRLTDERTSREVPLTSAVLIRIKAIAVIWGLLTS
jgi:hypothetical protein